MITADRATARLKPVILSHEQRDLISFLLEEAYLLDAVQAMESRLGGSEICVPTQPDTTRHGDTTPKA